MSIDISKLTKEWSYSKIRNIRDILTKNKINKSGRLSKSLKIKLISGQNPRIEFYAVFYGKYVRAHYLKKQNLDIYLPLSDVKDLMKNISTDLRKQIIEEVVSELKSNNK